MLGGDVKERVVALSSGEVVGYSKSIAHAIVGRYFMGSRCTADLMFV